MMNATVPTTPRDQMILLPRSPPLPPKKVRRFRNGMTPMRRLNLEC